MLIVYSTQKIFKEQQRFIDKGVSVGGPHSRKQMSVATLHIKFRYCKIINGYIDNRLGYIPK